MPQSLHIQAKLRNLPISIQFIEFTTSILLTIVLFYNSIAHFGVSLTILIIPYPYYLLVFIIFLEQSTFNSIHQVTAEFDDSVVIHSLHSSSQ